MKIKTIAVLLVLSLVSIMVTGCIDDNEPVIIEQIPEDIIDETPEEVEEIPVEEEEEVVEETPIVDPQTLVIRLEYYQARPSTLEINRGDTVIWRNRQDPKKQFTLVSEDGLWDDTNLVYGRTLIYTFNESGTYNFSVLGQPRMSGSILVN